MSIGDINRKPPDRAELLKIEDQAWTAVGPLLSEFLETLHDGVIVVSAENRIKYLNSSYLRAFGLSPADLHVGQDLYSALLVLAKQNKLGDVGGRTPQEAASYRVAHWHDLDNQIEHRPLPSGVVLDIYRTRTTNGDVFSVCVDVTETQRKTQELALHQTYMQSLLANTSDAITLIDAEGRFAMFNDKLLELYEIDASRVYWGIPYNDMVLQFGDMRRLPKEERIIEAARRRTFAFDPTILTTQRPLSNGRTLNINKTNLPGGGCVLTIRDITEELRREAELINARHVAEQSNILKTEFVARMSHEMRTPMNGILGSTALLLRAELDEQQRKLLDVITGSGEVLLRLIDDVLDLSRLDADAVDLVEEDVNITAVIDQSIGIVRPAADAQGLDIRIKPLEVPAEAPLVRGDVVRIKQILLNLLTNGVKFTEKGHVEVSLDHTIGPEGVTLAIEVTDTGVGIAEDKLEQIFENFYQIDGTATRRHGGAGLGLAITQRLVDLMGGAIQVCSEVGIGTVFRVTLTLPPAQQASPRQMPER
ncbi:MAG: ATP-binding protein [Paracoccaceae bacterium]